jgi:hypothetical protein
LTSKFHGTAIKEENVDTTNLPGSIRGSDDGMAIKYVPFVLKEKIDDSHEAGVELIVSQPIAVRPRGLSREVQALNEMSKGFNGSY